MIEDNDRCEWVNVSSGMAHPGCPGQSSESRKMLVVALVLVLVVVVVVINFILHVHQLKLATC